MNFLVIIFALRLFAIILLSTHMDGYYRSFHDALCVGMGRSRIGELFIIIEIKKEICRKRVLLRVERKFCVPSPQQLCVRLACVVQRAHPSLENTNKNDLPVDEKRLE